MRRAARHERERPRLSLRRCTTRPRGYGMDGLPVQAATIPTRMTMPTMDTGTSTQVAAAPAATQDQHDFLGAVRRPRDRASEAKTARPGDLSEPLVLLGGMGQGV